LHIKIDFGKGGGGGGDVKIDFVINLMTKRKINITRKVFQIGIQIHEDVY
jgi:hypothetical protein